jgi:uncharacterized protein YbjT (DUF2867 family)
MKVIVIGANGKTGTRIVKLLKESDVHEPVAMIRDLDHRPHFNDLGVTTVLGNLEFPIDQAISGCDAVIFAAGSGGQTGKDKTVLVDHIGAIRSMVAAEVQGACRYVMLSSINADESSESKIAHYHKAKAMADRHLMDTELDWTIICPGGLRDDEGNGLVSVSKQTHREGITTRDNLAACLVACLDLNNTIGKRFSLLEGETPVLDALRSV